MREILRKWTLCLAALMVMGNSFAADADTPDGFSAPTWYKHRDREFSIEGKGSFDNPIIVKTAGELAQIAWLVNEQGNTFSGKVVMLDADIDLKKMDNGELVSWIPIGKNKSRRFKGIFIGVNPKQDNWKQGVHKISNMYLSASSSTYTDYYGLFGYCEGFIGYLAMDGVTINATSRNKSGNVGSLCGTMAGTTVSSTDQGGKSFSVPVSICAVAVKNASMTLGSMASAGGIVGKSSRYGLAHTSFEGELTTTSSDMVGGICGFLEEDAYLFDCAAQVSIKGGTCLGGIVGKQGDDSTILTCAASGKLTDGTNVGGICGQQKDDATIGACSSAAYVSGSSRVGGIVGWSGTQEDDENLYVSKMIGCVFTGRIHPTGNSYSAGGICGSMDWVDHQAIDRCLFLGELEDPGNRKGTDCYGLIVGRNGDPNSTVASCYIDQSICGSGRVAGKTESNVTVKSMITQQLITGNMKNTPLLKGYDRFNCDFQYKAGFYPRAYSNASWNSLQQFKASGCSEACRKLFNQADMLKDNSVCLAQSWLCSVPVVIRIGDCAMDFVSTAEVKRTNATIDMSNGSQVKLRNNCVYPKSSCVEISGDIVSAREKGQCVLTLTTTEDTPTSFDRPKAPQAVKELLLNILFNPWDGTVAKACAAGTGKVDDPYIIKTGAQLAYAIQKNKEGEYYEQLCDITLNENLIVNPYKTKDNRYYWIAESWGTLEWKANYDGKGHFIKGAYIYKINSGLFGDITATGSVSNLGIIDSQVLRGSGLFAGTMDGTITNCLAEGQVTGTVTTSYPYYWAGGFCSTVGKNNESALIEDCITAVSSGYYSFADFTPFVSLSNNNKGKVCNCLCVVPMTHLDEDYKNSGITASGKDYIKDCYWLQGYEEMPTGQTLDKISEQLGKRELWQTSTGYFPTLKTFANTDMGKLLMIPFRTDVEYSYDSSKGESDNYLLAVGRQILFEPGASTWDTYTQYLETFLEIDTDMGVVVPMKESYDPERSFYLDNRTMPGLVFMTGKLGNAKHYVPVRARRGNVNAGFSFEDENAREACLAAFDTNHNNVLSLSELKAATNAQTLTAFQTPTARKIKSFPEFRFFKNVTELTEQLNGLTLLEKVQLPYALQTLGTKAFNNCNSLKQVTIPSRMTAVKPGAFYSSKIENILVDPFNETFVSRDGVLFTKDDGLVAYPNGRTSDEAIVTGTVSDMASGAFYKVPNLRKLFFDTTDYTTVPVLAEGALTTDDGSMMDVYVSDATEDHMLLDGYKKEPSWTPYFAAGKVHQYFPLKISDEVTMTRGNAKSYVGTFYIGFGVKLPDELTPFIISSVDEDNYLAYYHEKNRLIPPLQPLMVLAEKPGTYRLQPIEGELERWLVQNNKLIGVNRDGLDIYQSDSEQGSIMTPQMSDGQAGFFYEKKTMIEPYHCYLTYNTIDKKPEIAKNAHYDLLAADQVPEAVKKGDFTFSVMKLLPDNQAFAKLTDYNGPGGNVSVPGTLDDGTPITEIGPRAFSNAKGTINSIDMTRLVQLEAFDNSREDYNSPLGNLDERTYVYLPKGVTTPATNIILDYECSDLQLREGWDFYAPQDFHAAKVGYDRVLRATQNADGSWNSTAYTICMPFSCTFELEADDDITFYKLVAVTDDHEFIFRNNFNFYSAGTPAVVVVNKGDYQLNVSDVDVVEVVAESLGDEYDVVYSNEEEAVKGEGTQVGWWKGTFRKIDNEEASERHVFGLYDKGEWKIIRNDTERYRTGYIPAFRAFYEPLEFTGNWIYKSKFIYVENGEDDEITKEDFPANSYIGDLPDYGDDDPTGIRPVIHTIESDGTHRYFDLQGRQLKGKPSKGLYINNGKKVIIK